MKKLTFKDENERRIAIGWAVNNAVQCLSEDSRQVGMEIVKQLAYQFLDLREELLQETNACESCGGLSSNKEKVVSGLHETCRTREYVYKKKEL